MTEFFSRAYLTRTLICLVAPLVIGGCGAENATPEPIAKKSSGVCLDVDGDGVCARNGTEPLVPFDSSGSAVLMNLSPDNNKYSIVSYSE